MADPNVYFSWEAVRQLFEDLSNPDMIEMEKRPDGVWERRPHEELHEEAERIIDQYFTFHPPAEPKQGDFIKVKPPARYRKKRLE